jgi:hypothetical protein
MNRPIVKYVVRVALFASTVAALACSNSTAPVTVNAKNPALKDSTTCLSGWVVVQGIVTCGG